MSLPFAIRAAIVLLPLALSACVSAPAPQYPNDHPASSAAAAAPRSPQSQTLRSYRATTSSVSAPMDVAPPAETIPADTHTGHRTEAPSDPTLRLLQKELSVDTAVQIALLNNRDLQGSYASLGIAQADLVEAGLLENPVFSYTSYCGQCGIDRRGFHRAGLRERAQSVCTQESRRGGGGRATLRSSQRVLDLARQVQDAILHRGRRRAGAGAHARRS